MGRPFPRQLRLSAQTESQTQRKPLSEGQTRNVNTRVSPKVNQDLIGLEAGRVPPLPAHGALGPALPRTAPSAELGRLPVASPSRHGAGGTDSERAQLWARARCLGVGCGCVLAWGPGCSPACRGCQASPRTPVGSVVSWHLPWVRVHGAGARPGPLTGRREPGGSRAGRLSQAAANDPDLLSEHRPQEADGGVNKLRHLRRRGRGLGQSKLIKLRRTLRREDTWALGSAASHALDAAARLG